MFQEPTGGKKNSFVNMSGIDLPSRESIYVFMIKMDTESSDNTTLHISPINIPKQLKQHPLKLTAWQQWPKSRTLAQATAPFPREL